MQAADKCRQRAKPDEFLFGIKILINKFFKAKSKDKE